MRTNRLESFSDGVIAVAITLLVLGIAVPPPTQTAHLDHALLKQWPQYAAYATSFLTIGIIWINHHAMISRLANADHAILILNLLLLMAIGALPFATELLATYLREAHGENLAAGIYGGAFLLMAVSFAVLNRHVLLVKSHMLTEEMPLERRRQILRHSTAGLIPYVIATLLAIVSPYITLGICAALAAFYAHPIASSAPTAQ